MRRRQSWAKSRAAPRRRPGSAQGWVRPGRVRPGRRRVGGRVARGERRRERCRCSLSPGLVFCFCLFFLFPFCGFLLCGLSISKSELHLFFVRILPEAAGDFPLLLGPAPHAHSGECRWQGRGGAGRGSCGRRYQVPLGPAKEQLLAKSKPVSVPPPSYGASVFPCVTIALCFIEIGPPLTGPLLTKVRNGKWEGGIWPLPVVKRMTR